MFNSLLSHLETMLLLIFTVLLFFGFHRLNLICSGFRTASIEDYLYKLARITGKSEHAIFHEAAGAWPVSEAMVEKDFKHYLLTQATPHYVNDFIRKHRHYLDRWRTPPY